MRFKIVNCEESFEQNVKKSRKSNASRINILYTKDHNLNRRQQKFRFFVTVIKNVDPL